MDNTLPEEIIGEIFKYSPLYSLLDIVREKKKESTYRAALYVISRRYPIGEVRRITVGEAKKYSFITSEMMSGVWSHWFRTLFGDEDDDVFLTRLDNEPTFLLDRNAGNLHFEMRAKIDGTKRVTMGSEDITVKVYYEGNESVGILVPNINVNPDRRDVLVITKILNITRGYTTSFPAHIPLDDLLDLLIVNSGDLISFFEEQGMEYNAL